MKTTTSIATVLLIAGLGISPVAATTIDDLQLAQAVDSSATAATEAVATGGELVIGGARDLAVTSDGAAVTATAGGGQLAFQVPAATTGTMVAVWDGEDGAPQVLDPTGLGGVDLTDGGSHDALAVTVLSATGVTLVVEIHSDAASWSAFGFALPDTASPTAYLLPYGMFAVGAGAGARFNDVGAVVLRVEGSDAELSLGPISTVEASPQILVTQRDLDATALGGGSGGELGSTPRSPGDTYTLTMTITNTGDEATGVAVDELLDTDLWFVGAFRSTPIVRDDRYSSCLGAPVVADGTSAPGLIEGAGNDSDPDGQSLTVVGLQAVSDLGGAVALDDAATGRFTYVPPVGVTGVDRFVYTVADTDGNAVQGEVLVSLKTADQCAGCDHDGDGYLHPACGGSDCDDFRADIHPGADEVCDGLDNDCDGSIDEGFPPDCDPCDSIPHFDCTPGDVRSCGSDVGMCVAGTEVCDAAGSWSGVCDGSVGPVPEVPNGLDDDCDGTADQDQWPITTPCPDIGDAWRVMAGAAPGGNGLSWATAFATIDEALAAGASCDEIWVSGAHTLPATVAITSPIRIYGGFDGTEITRDERDPETNVTTFDGGGAVSCFEITAGTLLDGLTIANCFNDQPSEGGAIVVTGALLHVRDSVFSGNVNFRAVTFPDSAHGGAIGAFAGASVAIEGSLFESNHSRFRGGAVAVIDSDLVVRDSRFVGNIGADANGRLGSVLADGGAVYASGAGTVAIIDNSFEANRSASNAVYVWESELYIVDSVFSDHGCAYGFCPDDWQEGFSIITVRVEGSTTAVVQGTRFERNSLIDTPDIASGSSGVLAADDGAQLKVSQCEFIDNHNLALSAQGTGATTLEVDDSMFTGNVRSMYTNGVPTTVASTRFERDRDRFWTVSTNGIQEPWGTVSFTDCTFADNLGSALALFYADAVVDRSVFARNAGHFYGGALELDHSDLGVTSSLIVDNTCDESGAAAFVDGYSTLNLDHVTVVGNTMADPLGAAVRAEDHSAVNVTNSVVWGNWPRTMRRDSTSAAINPTYSVVPDELGWGDPSLHNVVDEPALVAPSSGDFRLSAWSPALDMGAPGPVPVDYDGRTWDFDGDGDGVGEPDPGAYEYVDDVPNLPPIAVAAGGIVLDAVVDANGIPYTDVLLSSDRTCDPNGDFLFYTWYGPGGLLSAADPQMLLPQGTSLLTLVTDDGALSSDPFTIGVHIQPCRNLTAIRTGSDAQLTWTGPQDADVYRARGTKPFAFGLAALSVSSGFVDTPPADLEVALYAVAGDDCASNVVAVFVGDAPPANSPPVIWSTPADYGDSLYLPLEPVTLVTARFGIPYSSHVRAADPDGDPLTFALVTGPAGAVLDPDGLLTWVPDQTGQHPVSIEVSDGNGGTATQNFTIQVDNRAPTADAGRAYTMSETGVTVTLDGTGSSDPDGDPLGYAWQLVSAPKDSTAALSDPNAAQPELTPDLPGRYELSLVVDDGLLTSLPDATFVETLDIPPVAVATYPNVPGPTDQTHWRGDVVQLDGSGSWDPEGRPLSFQWTMVRRPAGSLAVLFDPTSPSPTFIADAFGEYDVMLVVSDGQRTSAPAWSFLAARNHDPVADAGPNRNAAIGETVTFDCSRSSDPDGDPLVCRWYLTPPGGSSAVIIGGTPGEWVEAFEVAFVPDVPGTYWVDHQAVDPAGALGWVTVQVTVEAGTNPPVITTTPATSAIVDQPWTYDADSTDPDPGDTASWSLAAAPDGMTVDAATGVVAWTPDASQLGDHEVELHVTDFTGLVAAQPFTLTVGLEPAPPRLGCPAALWVLEGETLGRMLAAFDPNGDMLTFLKDSGPVAATVTDGELLWPTVIGDAGVHTLVVRVTDGTLDDTCSIEITVTAEVDDDGDHDGWSEADGDCDDTDPTVNPGAVDIAGDGIDQDCDGSDATRSVDVDGPTETIELLVGESVWIPHTIYVDRPDGAPGGLTLSQQVVPATGLQLETDFDDAPEITASVTKTATLHVTAELPGDYLVTTTITDTVTGTQGVVSTPVRVLDGASPTRMLAPGIVPGAVPINTSQMVTVAVRMIDGDPVPDQVWLDRTDAAGTPLAGVGWLADDGSGADLAAGDGVFSGTVTVPASPEGELYYRARSITSPEVVSEVAVLPVTRFPVGPPDSDLDDVVFHPQSGSPVLAGEVAVTFVPGTTPSEIESAAASLGASVAGYLPGLEVYVLAMSPLTSGDDLAARLAAVEAHPLIDSVDDSSLIRVTEVPVDDPVQQQLFWTDPIHSSKGWVFGFGGSSVSTAVIDTGIDRWHPELLSNHRSGSNLFCRASGCSVQDDHAHGTHVAGIIAADSNNVGFAGMLPDTSVLVEKAFDLKGRGTAVLLAHALVSAANRGAKVINVSAAFTSADPNTNLLEGVDEYVNQRGALVVAAAGNENTTDLQYPAANQFSLAVAGVGLNEAERWYEDPNTGSNYGSWVDIAAPAEDVFTTAPTTPTTEYNAYTMCFDVAAGGNPLPLLQTVAQRREKGCYGSTSGTSLATPMVVGAAGMVLDRFPNYNALEVRKRLQETAVPRTNPLGSGLGHGLLNVQEAVFNGSFEAAEVHSRALAEFAESLYGRPCGDLVEHEGSWWPVYVPCRSPFAQAEKPDNHGWHLVRYGGIYYQPFNDSDPIQALAGTMVRRLGPILPHDGRQMAMLSTGRAAETTESVYGPAATDYWTAQYLDILEQTFTIAPGQSTLTVSFWYDFVTEEAPYTADRLDLPDPDAFSAVLYIGARREVLKVRDMWEMEPSGVLSAVDGLTLSGFPVRHTGWQPVNAVVNIDPSETGPITIRFAVSDEATRDLDSVLLIDEVTIE